MNWSCFWLWKYSRLRTIIDSGIQHRWISDTPKGESGNGSTEPCWTITRRWYNSLYLEFLIPSSNRREWSMRMKKPSLIGRILNGLDAPLSFLLSL
jgi:hypothetical protein